MNYLLDENMPPYLVRAIAALHAREYPDDRIASAEDIQAESVDDESWIESLVQSGEPWTVLTRDLMRREYHLEPILKTPFRAGVTRY